MNRHLLFCCCFLVGSLLRGQSVDYFQQEVHYDIEVTLDDTQHELRGTARLEYTNHSPDALASIYFHLWANAYQSTETAFAKQQLRIGQTKFQFADPEDRGGYRAISFRQNGQELRFTYDAEHPDIAKVELIEPLRPGASVELEIPFTIDIPKSYSRFGHVDQSYQMTQWYPKPAVYDQQGWHPMPYLDLGEFYSEFGSFKVAITLPKNYVVGASGTLETAEEVTFLREKVIETAAYFANGGGEQISREEARKEDVIPPSSTEMKTIRYQAENVHDFAWFADKRFRVQKGEVELPSGRVIDTWTMFTRAEDWLWGQSIDYVNRSVQWYSEEVGEYPYPQATAIQSALSAGAGMEYPMITVIGYSGNDQSLDIVITHEVGHNWFYGILGSNERDFAWMDEGLNSFYEAGYNKKYYGTTGLEDTPRFLNPDTLFTFDQLIYLFRARAGLDQAPQTSSNDLSVINYQLGAYTKPALALQYLQAYLGEERFKKAMQYYYETWKFKHPQPEDFQKALEQSTGEDLEWFFAGLIEGTNQLDYAIKKAEIQGDSMVVELQNKGNLVGPVLLQTRNAEGLSAPVWVDGFTGTRKVSVPAEGAQEVLIDGDRVMLEVDRSNNRKVVIGKSKNLFWGRATSLPPGEKKSVYWLPIFNWNNYDKTQIGLLLHNYQLVDGPFRYGLAPMVSTVDGAPTGFGTLRYRWLSDGPFQRITLGATGRTFRMNYNYEEKYRSRYYRVSPYLELGLRTPQNDRFDHRLTYQYHYLGEQNGVFDADGFQGVEWSNFDFHELRYVGVNTTPVNGFQYSAELEFRAYEDAFGEAQSYLRLAAEWKQNLTYMRGRDVKLRLFAGTFLMNSRREAGGTAPGAFQLTGQGFGGTDDYGYQDYFLGRNDNSQLWSQQVAIRDGGFKNAFGKPFTNVAGNSNDFLLALNLSMELPKKFLLKLPIEPYADVAYASNRQPSFTGEFIDQLWWSAGLSLNVWDGFAAIYFPLVHSQNIQDLYKQDGRDRYWSRITFNLDLSRINPERVPDLINF